MEPIFQKNLQKIAQTGDFGHFLDFALLAFLDFAHKDRWASLVVFLQLAIPVNVFLFLCKILHTYYSLSNSNYFTSTKICRREKCIIDFRSAKMEFASAKRIFPNIQLKDVVNRLPPFKNLYDHTNSFLTG